MWQMQVYRLLRKVIMNCKAILMEGIKLGQDYTYMQNYMFMYVVTQGHYVCICAQSLSCVQLFVTPWTAAHRLLCPQNFPGKKTGVGCPFLLQKIFPIQDQTCTPALTGRYFTNAPGKPHKGICQVVNPYLLLMPPPR